MREGEAAGGGELETEGGKGSDGFWEGKGKHGYDV